MANFIAEQKEHEDSVDSALLAVKQRVAKLNRRLTPGTVEELLLAARNAWSIFFTSVLLSGNQHDKRGYALRRMLKGCEQRVAKIGERTTGSETAHLKQRIDFYVELLRLLHEAGFEEVDAANRHALNRSLAQSNLSDSEPCRLQGNKARSSAPSGNFRVLNKKV